MQTLFWYQQQQTEVYVARSRLREQVRYGVSTSEWDPTQEELKLTGAASHRVLSSPADLGYLWFTMAAEKREAGGMATIRGELFDTEANEL